MCVYDAVHNILLSKLRSAVKVPLNLVFAAERLAVKLAKSAQPRDHITTSRSVFGGTEIAAGSKFRTSELPIEFEIRHNRGSAVRCGGTSVRRS